MTRRELALALYLPSFLVAFAQGALVPTMPIYATEFTASLGLVSFAVAALALGTLLSDVPSGMILDRLGRRPMMLLGTAMVATSCLGLAVAQTYPELIVWRLVAGLGTAFWGISRLAFVTDAVPLAIRGRALSTFGGVQRIGTFVGPVAGGLLGAAFGLRVPFLLAGGLALGATAVAYFFVPETAPAERTEAHGRWRALGRVARRHAKDLAGAGSAQVFAQTIRSGRQIIVPLYAYEVLGMGVGTVGTIVSISAMIDMSLFLPAGMLMDRLGRKYASIPSFLVMALGMAILPFTHDFATLLGATAVMGLGNGLGAGAMMTLGADLAPREAAGEFLGLWRLIGDTGQMGGPLVVGGIADAVGLEVAAFVLAGIGVLAAGTIYIAVEETLHRTPPAPQPDSAGEPPPRRPRSVT